jgi:hypothetical protein
VIQNTGDSANLPAIMTVTQVLELLVIALVIVLGLSLLVTHALTGVPTMSAGRAEQADVVALLKQTSIPDDAIVYDLGCGWGAQLVSLARAFPDAQIRGIELSPFPYLIARLRTGGLANVVVRRGNFFGLDLGDAQAVICYLMPKAMVKLGPFLDRALKSGTPVVTLTFWFRDRHVAASRDGAGLRGAAALYIWPARKGDASRTSTGDRFKSIDANAGA